MQPAPAATPAILTRAADKRFKHTLNNCYLRLDDWQ
jgi:hypothetical protein